MFIENADNGNTVQERFFSENFNQSKNMLGHEFSVIKIKLKERNPNV